MYVKLIERNLHAGFSELGEDVFIDGVLRLDKSGGFDPDLDVKGDCAVVK